MKGSLASRVRRSLLLPVALSGAFVPTHVQANGAVVGWVEKPDFSAFRIVRDGVELPVGAADLQACDVVQLKNDAATVRITLSAYHRLQLDSTVPKKKIRVPCDEKATWYGKPLAVIRAIAGLATAPAPATNFETIVATRSPSEPPRLTVPALGNYDPLLVAGERSLYITWKGGVTPYKVTLRRHGGGNVVERTNISGTSVRLPKLRLDPGRYELLIQGSNKYGIKEENITVVEPSRLPPQPKALTDAHLPRPDHELLYAYYLEGSGHGEWTLEALQHAASITPQTPAVRRWLQRRFSQEGGREP